MSHAQSACVSCHPLSRRQSKSRPLTTITTMKPLVPLELSEKLRKQLEELTDGELRELLLVLHDEFESENSTADVSDET